MAQWIARSTSNRKVAGSNPAESIHLFNNLLFNNLFWFHSVMVITRGFDPRDLGSIPSETFWSHSQNVVLITPRLGAFWPD